MPHPINSRLNDQIQTAFDKWRFTDPTCSCPAVLICNYFVSLPSNKREQKYILDPASKTWGLSIFKLRTIVSIPESRNVGSTCI